MTNFDYGTVSANNTSVNESPIIWIPGVDAPLSLQISGTGTLASPTMELYENGTKDVSSTKLSGSMSITGRVIVCKSFSGLIGGNTYKYYVRYTDGGASNVREGLVIVPKLGANPSKYPSALNWFRAQNSPITIYPNQTVTDILSIDGEGALSATSMSLYRGTADVSSTLLANSLAVSGREITLKQISGLTAGDYIAYVFFTDGGVSTCRYFEIVCPKLGV